MVAERLPEDDFRGFAAFIDRETRIAAFQGALLAPRQGGLWPDSRLNLWSNT